MTLPRRFTPTHEERVAVVVSRVAGGSSAGSTRYARPVSGLDAAGARSIPAPKTSGGPVLVAEVCPTAPDTNQELTTPVVDYRGGAYFEQAVSGSFRVDASGGPGYFAVRVREVTPGYQVSYCQLVTFNDGNYHYLENSDPQAVDAAEVYFGDPAPFAGANVGTAITDYTANPGYAVELGVSGVYHFRVTLGFEAG